MICRSTADWIITNILLDIPLTTPYRNLLNTKIYFAVFLQFFKEIKFIQEFQKNYWVKSLLLQNPLSFEIIMKYFIAYFVF